MMPRWTARKLKRACPGLQFIQNIPCICGAALAPRGGEAGGLTGKEADAMLWAVWEAFPCVMHTLLHDVGRFADMRFDHHPLLPIVAGRPTICWLVRVVCLFMCAWCVFRGGCIFVYERKSGGKWAEGGGGDGRRRKNAQPATRGKRRNQKIHGKVG